MYVVDEQDVRRDRFDFVEDVARYQDASVCFAHSRIIFIVLRRIFGSMPDNGSSRMSSSGSWTMACASFHALTHALAVGPDTFAGGVHQVHGRQRTLGRGSGLASLKPFSRTSAMTHSSPVIRS